MSFHADPNDVEELEKLADQRQINKGALLSQILKSYLEWDHIAPKIGMIPIQRETVIELLNFVEDDDLKKIAAHAADKFMGKMLIMTEENKLDSFLNLTRIRIEKSGFAFSESAENGEMELVIQHRMGHKWSVFFSAFHERIISNMGHAAKTKVMDNYDTSDLKRKS